MKIFMLSLKLALNKATGEVKLHDGSKFGNTTFDDQGLYTQVYNVHQCDVRCGGAFC